MKRTAKKMSLFERFTVHSSAITTENSVHGRAAETAVQRLTCCLMITGLLLSLSACGVQTDSAGSGDGRIELTLATDDAHESGLSKPVLSFNQTNPDYKIKVIEYGYNAGDTNPDVLNAEIASGDAPDIFAFGSYTFGDAENSGAFLDLNECLNNDPDFCREDIVPSLLSALDNNGKLYWLPSSFEVNTFTAPESIVGEKTSLTMLEAEEYEKKMGVDSVFPKWMTRKTLLGWVRAYATSTFVNKSKGTCNFECQSFKDLLEMCKRQRLEDSPFPDEYNGSLLTLAPLSNFVIVSQLSETGDYSYVGFPADSGGSYFCYGIRFGINAKSADSGGAWEFIKEVFSDENQEAVTGFPTISSVFEKDCSLALDGELDTVMASAIKLSESDVSKLRKLIANTTKIDDRNSTICNIVYDDSLLYLSDVKTVDETAKLIQSQVSIYLAENG